MMVGGVYPALYAPSTHAALVLSDSGDWYVDTKRCVEIHAEGLPWDWDPPTTMVLVGKLPPCLTFTKTPPHIVTYEAAVVADQPTAYWRFNEGGGGVFADRSGHGYTVSLPPGVTGITYGVPGIVPDDPGISIADTLTFLACHVPDVFLGPGSLEVWIQPRDISVANAYAGVLLNANDGWGLWLERADITSPGTPGLKLSWVDGDLTAYATAILTPGTLSHIVLTRDPDGTGHFYINGALDSTFTGLISPMTIGCVAGSDYAPNALVADLLDECAIYPDALTAAQVADHYTARSGSLVRDDDVYAICGTPMQVGVTTVTITATDATGRTISRDVTITVRPKP